MNVAYNEISCADAAKMLGVDYSTVTKWCRDNKINHVNVSGGDTNGRYILTEDEVRYIKTLKDKFGNQFIRKYRKDWKKGTEPVKDVVYVEPTMPVTTIKSVVTNITTEEHSRKRVDIDEVAIKIGYIQDIKDKLEALEVEKTQLLNELEGLRKEVMEYL